MSDGDAAAELAGDLAELFAVAPPEFVATRNALAKRLRGEKRKDAAAVVAKLRRPGWVDWALNAVAREDSRAVEDFADAAEVLREAQAASIEGRDGPDLRGALKALRETTAALARQAGATLERADRQPDNAEIAARLGEVASQESAIGQLRAGVLGSADPGDDDPFAGLTPAERPAAEPERRAAAGVSPARRAPAKRKAKDEATEAANAVDEDEASEAANAVDEDEEREAADDVDERARAKERAAERARLAEAVDAARAERDEAAAAFAAAQRALDQARASLDEAEDRLAAARAELERADAGTLAP